MVPAQVGGVEGVEKLMVDFATTITNNVNNLGTHDFGVLITPFI